MHGTTLEQRLRRLELQNGRWRAATLALGVFATLFAVCGASGRNATLAEVKAQRFVLVGARGEVQATLAMDSIHGRRAPVLTFREGGEVRVGPRLKISGGVGGEQGVYLGGANGQAGAKLFVREGRVANAFLQLDGWMKSRVRLDTRDGRANLEVQSAPYYQGSNISVDGRRLASNSTSAGKRP